MNRANQQAVVQEANMNLVNIRNAEIEYFRNFFNQFGTQCALMIGFIAGSVSQAPGLDNPTDSPYVFVVMYWVGSAGCVAAATHVLVCSVFISVFGQGLAIRGPLGSMITAIEGMIVEQQQVLFFFIITVIFFAFQAIGMYWIMMDSTSAIVSTVITVLAMGFWYHHSLRIYNRFFWNKENIDWDDTADPDEDLDDLYPDADHPYAQSDQAKSASKKGQNGKPVKKKSNEGADGPSLTRKASDSAYYGIEEFSPNTAESGSGRPIGNYMSILVVTNGMFSSSEAWERKYFVIKNTLIYYYKDQQSYEADASKPINRRPIDLEGYTLIAGNREPPYSISLIPADPEDIRKTWKFRVDTIGEFNQWVKILTDALAKCKSEFSQSEVVRIPGGTVDDVAGVIIDDDSVDGDEVASTSQYSASQFGGGTQYSRSIGPKSSRAPSTIGGDYRYEL